MMVSNRNLLSQGSIFRGKLIVAGRKHDCLLSDIGFAGRICVFFWGWLFQLMVISGLGPGGLDLRDPLMKGIGILRGPVPGIPNHQLTIR